MRSRLLPLSALGLTLFLAPATARAAEAMCSNQFGQCTVSNNNGIDFESCNCVDNSTTGGTGGNSYAGLTQAELMEICEDLLLDCDGAMAGDTGTDTGDTGDTGSEEGGTTISTSTGDGDGDMGDGDGDESGNSTTDTSGDESTSTSGSGDGDGDPGTTSTSGSGSDTDDPTGDTASETTDGTTTSGASEDGGSGCGCTVNHAPGIGFFALWIIGLIGIQRRERSE